MKKFLTLFLITLILYAPISAQRRNGSGASPAAARYGNVDAISARQMKEHLSFIASDELEGRDTPSRGLDIAALYIAQHLGTYGLKPAGDNGTYFQKFPLKRHRVDAEKSKLSLNGRKFDFGVDFLSAFNAGSVSGSLVYGSHGWVIKSKNINPYQGIDVKDKILIASAILPKVIAFNELKGPNGGDWISPRMYAQLNGAKAIILLGDFDDLAGWQATKAFQADTGSVTFGGKTGEINIPTITISPRLIAAMFRGEKVNGAALYSRAMAVDFPDAFDLAASKKLEIDVAVRSEDLQTQNVVAILEGSDPVLKNEYVAIGAHYDHVGMNPNLAGPDKIFNGADDDGSGTVAVMAIAEAMSKGPRPKRSILFIWHAGEEKGLWGSEYFADNPTVPITSIITQLNIDMIGRYQNPGDENHPQNKDLPKQGEVFLIGSRMMSTDLGELSDSVNKSFLNLAFNFKYDDPNDPEQFFYRSDHFNYAKKGIPIIFYMDGSHADYHKVTDSIEKINFESMEKVTRTIFATGWELANRATRPKVDKPLPALVTGAN